MRYTMLSGIFGKRHKLTFGSDSSGRFGAKKSYRAGARVALRIPLATDTDYSIAATVWISTDAFRAAS